MPDIRDPATLSTAATAAASRGDAAEAARLLRLALDQQVGALGPDHRDLAPTLNNLAMMLEQQGETAEAERCYRRAYDVARRALPSGDPQVQMSRANLIAFLQASGVAAPDVDQPLTATSVESDSPAAAPRRETAPVRAEAPTRVSTPPPGPRQPPTREPQRVPGQTRPPEPSREPVRGPGQTRRPESTAPASTAPAPGGATRGSRFAPAITIGALAVALGGWLLLGTRTPEADNDAPSRAAADQVEPPVAPSAAAPPSGEPTMVPAAPSPEPLPASPPVGPAPPAPAVEPSPTPPRTAPPAAAASGAAQIGVDGTLCATLARSGGVWRCEPVSDPLDGDAIYYYTRVRSGRDILVRHRWTHEGEVVRTVPLEVRANPQQGFRTFSRQSLAGRSGTWEVALVAPDGTVVDRQQFRAPGRE